MRYWNITDRLTAGINMTDDLLLIVNSLGAAFDAMDKPKPSLLSIGRHDDVEDANRYEALIELSPGVRLPMEWGSPDLVLEGFEHEGDEQQFVDRIVEYVGALRQHFGPTHLADMLHVARCRVRRVLAQWQNAGHISRLEDVRLEPFPFWLDVHVPPLVVLIEGLDRALRPEIWEMRVTEASIVSILDAEQATLARRLQRRAGFWREGASGSIDRIAINALTQFGDVAEGVRRFAVEDRFWLPDDTCVSIMDGHISIGNGNPGASWLWHHNGVTVFQEEIIPDIALKAAKGRPSTVLLAHPFLSEDVIMIDASAQVDDGGRWSVAVTFEQPKFLFCAISGRIWEC